MRHLSGDYLGTVNAAVQKTWNEIFHFAEQSLVGDFSLVSLRSLVWLWCRKRRRSHCPTKVASQPLQFVFTVGKISL